MNARYHNGVKALALMLGASCSTAALAQADIPLPPVRSPVDAAGVNLSTGLLQLTTTDVAIGTPDMSLVHQRFWMQTGWRHTYMASISIFSGYVSVTLGNNTNRFQLSGNTYVSSERDGSTLNKSGTQYTYRTANGTVVTFDRGPVSNDQGYYQVVDAVATTIVRPDGERLDLNYTPDQYDEEYYDPSRGDSYAITHYVVRLNTVTSSKGFRLRYGYASDNPYATSAWYEIASVTGENTVNTTPPAQGWPQVSYSRSGNTQTVTDAMAHQTRYTLDGNSRMAAIKRPAAGSDSTIYTWDGNGRVGSVSNGQASWGYVWTPLANNQMSVTITDPKSHQNVVTADASQGVILSQRDGKGRTDTFEYDLYGRMTVYKLPEGGRVDYTNDARGNVIETIYTAKPSVGGGQITTSAGYDTNCANPVICNQPIWTKDARGKQTDYSYDPTHGGVTSITRPASQQGTHPQTRFTYTPLYVNGNTGSPPVYKPTGVSTCASGQSCVGQASETRTTLAYNTPNLFLSSTSSGSGDGTLTATSSYQYDTVGNRISVDGPRTDVSDVTKTFYDADRRVIQVVGPDPDGGGSLPNRSVKLYRNADGAVEGTVFGTSYADGSGFGPYQSQTADYDTLGRVWRTQVFAGNAREKVMHYSYDAANNLQCVALRMNPSTLDNTNQPDGQSNRACDQTGAGVYGYDRITKREYDEADAPTLVANGWGSPLQQATQSFTYNGSGQVQTVRDGANNVTTYGYDGFNRPLRTTHPDDTYEEVGYDSGSLVTGKRFRDGTGMAFFYDDLGRLIYRNRPQPAAVLADTNTAYEYDDLSRMTRAYDSREIDYRYSYDALGRLFEETSTNGIGTLRWHYDQAGNIHSQQWADGMWTDYAYDATNALTRVRENDSFVLATYEYDEYGRRKTIARGNTTWTHYSYDGLSRLSSLTHDLIGTAQDVTRSFTYTPADEIRTATTSNDAYAFNDRVNVQRSYQKNSLNQYTTAGQASFGYDGRGNLTSSSTPQGTNQYRYTVDNLLAQTPGGNLIYDPLDRLITQTATSNILRYRGDQLTTEQSGSTIVRRYALGAGGDEPLVWYEGSGMGDRRWLYADERGSVVAVADQGGNTLAINTYDEYGIPGAANLGRFQYTGQTWLAEAQMYHYKARAYSPTLGRFLQPDPIGYGDGMNMYAYVGGSPLNRTDPSGMVQQTAPSDVSCPGGGGPAKICPVPTGTDIVVTGHRLAPIDYGAGSAAILNWQNSALQSTSSLGGGAVGSPQNNQRNGQKPPSHDEGDPDYNRDLNKCRALADAGNRVAASRCYSSAEARKGLRDGGTPESQLPPLITWKNAAGVAGGVAVGTILYWVISEGSRILFPPRNLIPVP